MPSPFKKILAELKRQERRLAAQLEKVRSAISLLEFGGGGVPAPAIIETPHAAGRRSKPGRRKESSQRSASERPSKRPSARRKTKQ
jgi:hypothetical protein